MTFTYETLVPYRVHTRTDAVNGTITYSYDDFDRVTQASYQDGTFEAYTYDPAKPLDIYSYKDRQGRITGYTHDADRRLTSMIDPKQLLTQYGWCSCGALASITDPKGNKTSFDRDMEGRLTQKSYQDGSSYKYQYDIASGRLISMTDAKNQVTQYGYDLDNRLLSINYTNAQNPTAGVTFSYDPILPRVTSMSDGMGMNLYNYYAIGSTGGGRLSNISQRVGGTSAAITYAYDNEGRPVTQSIDGTAENYGYSTGQLTDVTNPLGHFAYSYNSSSQLTEVAYPTTSNQNAQFDYFSPTDTNGVAGGLKDLTNNASTTQISKFSYTYQPTGEIKVWSQQIGNGSATIEGYSMGYDADSELQGVTLTSGSSGFDGLAANQSVTYGYDNAGNRTNETTPKFDHTFNANNLNQLTNITSVPISIRGNTDRQASVTVNGAAVTEDSSFNYNTTVTPAGGSSTPLTVTEVGADGTLNIVKNHVLNTVPFQYDANGNLVQDESRKYSWDAANRLISVTYLNPQPASVADNITFQYDGFGRRVGITEKHGTTILTGGDKRFVWCGVKLCQERDSTGATVNKQFFTWGEKIMSGPYAGNYYFTKDHLGNIRDMRDATGTVYAAYDYDPYGRQIKLPGGTLDADFGYTGFYMERAAGLDLTWFRAYDPEKGRWLNRDPLSERAGLNLYAMVGNNPINWYDPFGLCGKKKDPYGPEEPPNGNPPGGSPPSGPSQLPGGGNGPGQNPNNNPQYIPWTPGYTPYLPFPPDTGPGNLDAIGPPFIFVGNQIFDNPPVEWLDQSTNTGNPPTGFPPVNDWWDLFSKIKSIWDQFCANADQ